ncbi:MAG: hypothetical protein Q9225_003442 [Loekoesia sp. 1 TL-2023]
MFNCPPLEAGDSSTTEDSVVAGKTEPKKASGEPDHANQAASGLVVQDQQGKGGLGLRPVNWVKKKLRCLGTAFGFAIQSQKHVKSRKQTPGPLGNSTEYDGPNDPFPKDPECAQGGERASPVESRQQPVSEPESHQVSSGVILSDEVGLEPARRDAAKSTPAGPPVVQTPSKQTQRGQSPDQDLTSRQYCQSPTPPRLDELGPAPAVGVQTLESANSKETVLTKSSSSDKGVQSEDGGFKRKFQMVIHLPNDQNAQRVCLLDTGADLDVISHEVVESLRLKKNRYKGAPVKPLGGFFEPG